MVCPVPFLGPGLALCEAPSSPSSSQLFNMSKVASSREELAVVVDGVGEHQGLTADLVKHQFVVRDLRIRAAASKLPRKQDLVDYLEELIRSTWDAAQ